MRIERENLRKEQGNTSFTPRPQSKHVRCEAAFVRFNLRCPRLRKEVFPWNTVGWEKCGPVWHGCSRRWWGRGRGLGRTRSRGTTAAWDWSPPVGCPLGPTRRTFSTSWLRRQKFFIFISWGDFQNYLCCVWNFFKTWTLHFKCTFKKCYAMSPRNWQAASRKGRGPRRRAQHIP